MAGVVERRPVSQPPDKLAAVSMTAPDTCPVQSTRLTPWGGSASHTVRDVFPIRTGSA